MQALSAAIRCSCGLANLFDPPSSRGSSMSIENRRSTFSPPISKLSISARLRAWPCQVVLTCQFVLPFAVSRLTPSISANRSSTLMPLTTVGWVVFVCALMMGFLCLGLGLTVGLLQRRERLLDALALLFRDQARQHLAEVRVMDA